MAAVLENGGRRPWPRRTGKSGRSRVQAVHGDRAVQGRGVRQQHPRQIYRSGLHLHDRGHDVRRFTWTPSDTTGGTAPPATSEMVVPDGLGFDLDGLFAASSGAIADAILHYTATTTDESNNIDRVMLYAVGGQNGPGINGVNEVLCAGCLLAACPAGKLRAQRHRQWRCR